MKVFSGGNVGIGTDSPVAGSKLTVKDGFISVDTAGVETMRMQSATGEGRVASSDDLVFRAGGTSSVSSDRMRITAAGNVGIGDSSRFSFLTNPSGNLQLTGGLISDPGAGVPLEISNYRTTPITFSTGGSTEHLRIDSIGNVGIGTITAASRLHVSPSSFGGNQGDVAITLGNEPTTARGARINKSTDSPFELTVTAGLNPTTGSDLVFETRPGDETVRVTRDGFVGIGTSDPNWITTGTQDSQGVLSLGSTDAAVVTGDVIGALSFVTRDGSYTTTYNDGVGAQIAAVSESTVGGSYGLALSTGTTTGSDRAERVRIDAVGNVGIGTNDPTAPLSVLSASSSTTIGGSTSVVKVRNPSGIIGATSGMEFFHGNGETDIQRLCGVYGQYKTFNATGFGGDLVFATQAASESSVTERMRIDQNGNVGIGTSTFNLGSFSSPTLAVSGTNSGERGTLELGANITTTSSCGILAFTNAASTDTANNKRVAQISAVRNAGNNNLGALEFMTNDGSSYATRMAIKHDGDVGIGTANPVSYQTGPVLNIGSTSDTYAQLNFTTATNGVQYIGFGDAVTGSARYQGLIQFDHNNNTMGFGTGAKVGADVTIDSSGNLLVGKSSSSFSTSGAELKSTGQVDITSGSTPLRLNRTGAGTSSITIESFNLESTAAGGIACSTGAAPVSPSDERLKDNITDHESELDVLMSLRPVRWDWKDESKGSGEGFIAQELQETAWADLVSEGDDGMLQVSGLGMLQVSGLGTVETRLIKAMQEQQALIEELKAEVEALKNA
jgi:hypothetical protein